MNRIPKLLLALFGILLLGACAARPAAIGVDANYIVEVTNPMPHAMVLTADLGAAQMAVLGEIAAGETKRFEIRDPSTNDIRIIARNADNTHTVREMVELERGTVAKVTLDDD